MQTICLCWACGTRDQLIRDIHQQYSIVHKPSIHPTPRIIYAKFENRAPYVKSCAILIGKDWRNRFNTITIHFYWNVWPSWYSNTMQITFSHQLAVPRELDHLKQPCVPFKLPSTIIYGNARCFCSQPSANLKIWSIDLVASWNPFSSVM